MALDGMAKAIEEIGGRVSALQDTKLVSYQGRKLASPGSPARNPFTFATWQQAWEQVARLAEQDRLAKPKLCPGPGNQ